MASLGQATCHRIHVLIRGEQTCENIPQGSEDDYLLEFASKGLQAITVPILRFNYVNIEELSRLLTDSKPVPSQSFENQYDSSASANAGLILSSPRAVDAVARASRLANISDLTHLVNPDLVFVVGQKTAAECFKRLAIECNRSSTSSGSGTQLVKYITSYCSKLNHPIHLIYPRSSLAGNTFEDLPEKIPRLNLTSLVAYETRTAPDFPSRLVAELSRFVTPDVTDLVAVNFIFFSPSGVQSWHEFDRDYLNRELEHTFNGRRIEFSFSSIGKTTEAALVSNSCEIYCVANKPTAVSLVECLLNCELQRSSSA